ncbi:MAG: SET domain-containing protein-lysine N-methyltransferase [Hyphomicrobiaceae bacterium]|nr:SET domain-containing protein-lysine N-methyltransferase [Hyphomicrobiaceae bacterium]
MPTAIIDGASSNVDLQVKRSSIGGNGVFSRRRFAKGELVYRMGGKRVSLARCALEIVMGRVHVDDPLQIATFEYILLDEISRSFNHSCAPNTAIVGVADAVALRDIADGEEITYDYAMTVRSTLFTRHWRLPCHCGAAQCRGAVGDIRTVPLAQLRDALQRGLIQDYMLKEATMLVEAGGPAG